jgi:hypothetical protein
MADRIDDWGLLIGDSTGDCRLSIRSAIAAWRLK